MIIQDRASTARPSYPQMLAHAVRLARGRGASVLVSAVVPAPAFDPLAIFDSGREVHAERALWIAPGRSLALVGLGRAHAIETHGPTRFSDATAAWRELLNDAVQEGPSHVPGTGPLLLGGFSFDTAGTPGPAWRGFPHGRLVLPKYIWTRSQEGAWLTRNIIVHPDSDVDFLAAQLAEGAGLGVEADLHSATALRSEDARGFAVEDPDADRWRKAVGDVSKALGAGAIEKVVLARRVDVKAEHPIVWHGVLTRLAHNYPDCYLFAIARGDRCFAGATPEQLVRLEAGKVQAMGLAGSAPRGQDPASDEELGQALLQNAKDRAEHAVVVRALSDALRPVCLDLQFASEPVLRKLQNLQHLHTPVTGRLRRDLTLLDIVARVHPTPAVGGFPTDEALRVIRAIEPDRGWYAGPVGWLDSRGEGEFAVAIRSALLAERTAVLFAGCGIMADSDPNAEYRESCLKLRPMLSALGGRLS